MKKILRHIVVGLSLLSLSMACAKTTSPSSEGRFDRLLRKRTFVVAVFFQSDKLTKKNRQLQDKINELEDTVKSVSRSKFYHDGRVSFAMINVGKKKLSTVDDTYGVKELPTVVLFKDGVPVRDKLGSVVMRKGFFSRDQLDKFVQSHLKSDIEDYIEDRQAEMRRRREAYSYYRPYFYYGAPYYRYPSYYYRHYPYRYHHYSHGPYVGFGFYI